MTGRCISAPCARLVDVNGGKICVVQDRAMVQGSYHSHNLYCDGQGTVEDMVRAARDAGLTEVGISSHAPLPVEAPWTVPLDRFDRYVQDVRAARQAFPDLYIYLGLEVDFLPNEAVLRFQRERVLPRLDYAIGSVHILGNPDPLRPFDASQDVFQSTLDIAYGGDARAMVEDYFARTRAMLALPQVTIVGHMDRIKIWNRDARYFDETGGWYRAAAEETLQAVAAAGKAIELNTSGWRRGLPEPYPAPWILARARHLGVPVVLNSDAHRPSQIVWGFDRAQALLDELGIDAVPLDAVL